MQAYKKALAARSATKVCSLPFAGKLSRETCYIVKRDLI